VICLKECSIWIVVWISLLVGHGATRAIEGPPLRAFPGAEGFGANSVGGRGGAVCIVDTLKDYHPGQKAQPAVKRNATGEIICPARPAIDAEEPIPNSLRACLNSNGPRTILFAVAGTIELKAPLVVREPYLTIAGQSAPGGGICLKNFGLSVSATHDVIIRYLRVRPGDQARRAFDAINIGASRNVIIDHCSTSWAIDETLSISSAGSNNVTVQWCFITESLHDSYHPKGPHGMGSLLRTNGDVSFHHNFYAHHNARSPRPGTYGEDRSIFATTWSTTGPPCRAIARPIPCG
jgi:pectate lyase